MVLDKLVLSLVKGYSSNFHNYVDNRKIKGEFRYEK